jgi:hypothetical protein
MIPCFFDITVKERPLRLIFDIHQELINTYYKILDTSMDGLQANIFPSFIYFKKTETNKRAATDEEKNIYKEETFIEQKRSVDPGLFDEYWARNLFGNHFGAGKDIIKVKSARDFVRYEVAIPQGHFYDQNKVCLHCRGSKINPDYEDSNFVCNQCQGTGYGTKNNKQANTILADNISMLCRLTELLAYQDNVQINTIKPFTLYTILLNGGYGAQGIFGAYTKELADYVLWLSKNNLANKLAAKIKQNMIFAYSLMTKGRVHNKNFMHDEFEFICQLEKTSEHTRLGIRFIMQVPGQNSCSVFSYDNCTTVIPLVSDDGYREISGFTCHNVDSSAQQISLLVGLATLNTAARQWLNKHNNII